MTSDQWHHTKDLDLMFALLAGRADPRKWKLFTCACVRELGHLLADDNAREAFLATERAVESDSIDELHLARRKAQMSARFLHSSSFPRNTVDWRMYSRIEGVTHALLYATHGGDPEKIAVQVAFALRQADNHDRSWEPRVRELCANILRDLFHNILYPVDLPGVWLRDWGGEVRRIAATIYDDRSFDELPILADALEDAGCPVPQLIDHCRTPGPHGRGCWVVDVLR